MGYKITALFVDSRREFPHKFSELLWPQIQFSTFDRVGRVSEAFQEHMNNEFNMCFISDRIGDRLEDFFVDIAKLGRNKTCIFVKLISAVPKAEDTPMVEAGFHLAVHEQLTSEDHAALQAALGAVWREVEVGRRCEDIDGLVNLLMRQVDNAVSMRRRGRGGKLQHGATSLVRMHAEFDARILDQFMTRLSERTGEAEPTRKALKNIPLPLLGRKLPELTELGYGGASARVFHMLVDKFGEDLRQTAASDQVSTSPVSSGEGQTTPSDEPEAEK